MRHACFSQVGRGACSAQRQRLTILPHGIGTSGRACLSRQISECRRSTKSERESAGWRHLRRNRPARWTRCGCSRIVGSSPSVLPISRVRTASGRPVRHGLLQPVMKGWYVAASPDRGVGDSTAWYASFRGFCAKYLSARFDAEWCLLSDQCYTTCRLRQAGKRTQPVPVRGSKLIKNLKFPPHFP